MINNNRLHEQNEQAYHKMDNLFYRAIQRTIWSYRKNFIIHLIKLIIILIFLPIDLFTLKTQHSVIIMFMWMAIFEAIFNLFGSFCILYFPYSNQKDNNKYFLQYAAQTGHSVEQQPINSREQLDNLQLCASQIIYNAETGDLNEQQALTPNIRSKYQSIYSGYVEDKIFRKFKQLQFFYMIGKLPIIILFGFGIFALSVDNPNPYQKGVLITFLILQALNIWIFIGVIILVALSPIICVGLCFFMCCCTNFIRDNQILPSQLPAQVEVTNQIIAECDGSCPICFQTFVLYEKVIVLPCSKKHVFHKSCLQTWARVSKTCPVCRRNMDGSR